jgi:hypothetical protein
MGPQTIALTDAQLGIVQMLAHHIPQAMRGSYLRTIAALLEGQRIDDRAVSIAANAALRRTMGINCERQAG